MSTQTPASPSLRECLLPMVDELRDLRSPSELDQETTQITIRTRTWSEGRRDKGKPHDVDVVLPQRYKVVEMATREIAGSGGRYSAGDLKVHVTPQYDTGQVGSAFETGGFTVAQLAPQPKKNGIEIFYVLCGTLTAGVRAGVNGLYRRIDVMSHRAYRTSLILRRVNTTP